MDRSRWVDRDVWTRLENRVDLVENANQALRDKDRTVSKKSIGFTCQKVEPLGRTVTL